MYTVNHSSGLKQSPEMHRMNISSICIYEINPRKISHVPLAFCDKLNPLTAEGIIYYAFGQILVLVEFKSSIFEVYDKNLRGWEKIFDADFTNHPVFFFLCISLGF